MNHPNPKYERCPNCGEVNVMSARDGDVYRYICLTDFCGWELEIDTSSGVEANE